ncbi:hypothetical protein BC938DRAFT_473092 [Jimgerdemannia flammicorona]|uniref:Uncharacterized protein n=1 Tax=Jimgerdemannia flammicorona TaxID=994334 RepID=A0A433Q4P5_9FUNG|nr:hypothetical protein BC938DRAFT_473092 [Jimgerdemannia flammicorona]
MLSFIFSAAEMTQPIVDDATRDFQPSFCLDAELVEALRSASRYCQVRVTYEWMLEAVTKFVVKNVQIGEDNWRVMTSPGSSLLNPRQFLTIIRVMEVAKDYSTLIEVSPGMVADRLTPMLIILVLPRWCPLLTSNDHVAS